MTKFAEEPRNTPTFDTLKALKEHWIDAARRHVTANNPLAKGVQVTNVNTHLNRFSPSASPFSKLLNDIFKGCEEKSIPAIDICDEDVADNAIFEEPLQSAIRANIRAFFQHYSSKSSNTSIHNIRALSHVYEMGLPRIEIK